MPSFYENGKMMLRMIFWLACFFTTPLLAVDVLYPTASEQKSITPADWEGVKNPAMLFPNAETEGWGTWKPSMAKDPSVVRFQERYLMYFSIFPTKETPTEACLAIGVAESGDLTHWKFLGTVMPLGKVDQRGCGAPCAKVWDDQVHLFYQSYGNGARDTILYATSKDGLHFQLHPDNPIFSPSGDWTNGRAIDADFFEFQGKCFLYVATRDSEGKIQKIAVATAENRNHLGKDAWKQAFDGAILKPELPWETRCIEAPSVLQRGDKLFMFYAGGYNNDPQHVGVAQSSDGIRWTRLWSIPFLTNGPQGQWNTSESGHPGVFVDEKGETWLFFQGNATKGSTWFLSRVKIGWKGDIPYVQE